MKVFKVVLSPSKGPLMRRLSSNQNVEMEREECGGTAAAAAPDS